MTSVWVAPSSDLPFTSRISSPISKSALSAGDPIFFFLKKKKIIKIQLKTANLYSQLAAIVCVSDICVSVNRVCVLIMLIESSSTCSPQQRCRTNLISRAPLLRSRFAISDRVPSGPCKSRQISRDQSRQRSRQQNVFSSPSTILNRPPVCHFIFFFITLTRPPHRH